MADLPEAPWHLGEQVLAPVDLEPGSVSITHERNGIGVEAPESAAGWLDALGIGGESYRARKPAGKVLRWTRSPGAVLVLAPALSEETRKDWGIVAACKGRNDVPGAPAVLAVTGHTTGIGPWEMEDPLPSGYAAALPWGTHWGARAAGWTFHKETGLWVTRDLRRVAALAGCAEANVRERLARRGLPAMLIPWLRAGPVLIPWAGKKWHIVCSRSAKHGFRCPGLGWRDGQTGWETTNAGTAAQWAHLAPRPLARYLIEARDEHALERVTASSVELLLGGGAGRGGGRAPKVQKVQVVWCPQCRDVAATIPLAEEAGGEKCIRGDCGGKGESRRTKLPLTTLVQLRERAGVTREAWRKIGWRMAEAAVRNNKVEGAYDVAKLVPAKGVLRPTQEGAVLHALEHRLHVNATEMGGGKTIVSLVAISQVHREAEGKARTLVVCPAALAHNWLLEAAKWLEGNITVIHGKKASTVLPGHGVAIASYQRISRWPALARWTEEGPLDVVVCDEGHRAKNWDAKVTRAVYAIPARRRQVLTGTFVPNRPSDVQPVLGALCPEAFGNAGRFRWAYAVKDVKAATAEEEEMCVELGEQLRASVLYRPDTAEVLGDLPAPWPAEVVEIEIEGGKRIGQRERELWEEKERGGADTLSVLAQLQALRGEVGDGKLAKASEIVPKITEEGEKTLIFTMHRRIAAGIDAWARGEGRSSRLVDGSLSQAERQERQHQFMYGSTEMLVLTFDAGGEGLNLQKAGHVVIMELDWRPKMIEQAIGRAQRPGRKDRLKITYVVAKDTLDGHMAETIVGKSRTIDQTMGDTSERVWWTGEEEPTTAMEGEA